MLQEKNIIKSILETYRRNRNKLRYNWVLKYPFSNKNYSEIKFSQKEKRKQKLIVTILSRDEIVLIEPLLKFYIMQGADKIIVTDNGSIDGTRDVLLKYQDKGYVHLIDEPSRDFDQKKWTNRMIKVAKEEYQADWILNSDSDEFFLSKTGNLKDALPINQSPNTLICMWKNALPLPKEDWNEVGAFFENGNYKTIHSVKGYKESEPGNHRVRMKNFKNLSITEDITCFHFRERDFKNFRSRIKNRVEMALNSPLTAKSRVKRIKRKFLPIYNEIVNVSDKKALGFYHKYLTENYNKYKAQNRLILDDSFKKFIKKVLKSKI